MASMHESEKAASQVDVRAARINAEAAEVQELVAEHRREARSLLNLGAMLDGEGGDDRRCQLLLQAETADQMTKDLQIIRAATQRLQDSGQRLLESIETTAIV